MAMRRQTGDVGGIEADGAGLDRKKAGEDAQNRRFSGAVGTEHDGDAAGRDLQIDAAQDRMAGNIAGHQFPHLQFRRRHGPVTHARDSLR